MAKLVSNTYGDALFDLAISENKLEEIVEEINTLKKVFLENDELVKLLNHPKIVKEEKIKFIETTFNKKISDETLGFLVIIINKGRQAEIFSIFDYFNSKVKKYKNIGVASVTSAVELNKKQKAQIKTRLLETTNYVEMEIKYKVDKSILGGLIIRIEDRVVDSSIKTQIEKMSRTLSKIQLS